MLIEADNFIIYHHLPHYETSDAKNVIFSKYCNGENSDPMRFMGREYAYNYNAEFYDFAGWKPLEFDKWLDILKSKPMVKFYVGFYDSEWGYY